MKSEIITLLRQRRDYVSGQELSERFGVSRTAVWKAVEQLKKDGYDIEAVKNRGYLLKEEGAPGVFGYTEIRSRIKTKWAGQTLYYFDETDSTNIQVKRLAEENAPEGTIVIADKQTAGRGRRGRAWESPAGANLYFSLLLRPRIAPDKASMVTLVMALSVAQGIRKIMEAPESPVAETKRMGLERKIGIKWPNDIVIDGRKVCGILTEMSLSLEMDSIQYVVSGVGINVHRQAFAETLQGHATALEEFGHTISRSELLNAILEQFETYYEKFLAEGSLAPIREEYNAILVNRDQEVRVLDPKGEFDGIARGIRDTGELIVELPSGEQKEIYAGEVSVRGIYGYV